MNKQPIAIIGAGNSGLAMAAHLSLNGEKVRLWNRSDANIKELSKSMIIKVDGEIKGEAGIEAVSSDMETILDGVNLILVTVPANSHKDIAKTLSPYIKGKETIILNPGRTFGALEFNNVLLNNGCYDKLPIISEAQTIIYTCRKSSFDTVFIHALKKEVFLATKNLPKGKTIIQYLPDCLHKHFVEAESIVVTSIGNVGMILHCAPTILNTGWIESPITNFKYYYEGITPSIAFLLEKLDQERVTVSSLLGRTVETTKEWLKRSFGVKGETLYDCIHNNEAYKLIEAPESLQHRYIYEDISCGLVPIEAVGKKLGIEMKVTGLIIDIANEILNYDFRKNGRDLNCLGFGSMLPQEIINIFLINKNLG